MSSLPARPLAALVAVLAAAAVVGCGGQPSEGPPSGGYVAPGIPETPVITGEPANHNADDVAFATNMIAHHKQAIELSELVPERTSNPALQALAKQIAEVQQPEINIMNVLLVQWNENPDLDTGPTGGEGHAGHQAASGMVDDATIAELKSLRDAEFDALWLKSMIGHHRGAVEMAKAEVANGVNIDAIAMAETMATTQQAEIEQMEQMLERPQP
ncbi:MAG: DUF305 domain-containing protein [Mycolicibacterium sp.]|uniref:DUF305 domain-containing protein n=1 Tax=Mycolicibacterium sp. TaxID=2320850 RepID=UPI003D150EFA